MDRTPRTPGASQPAAQSLGLRSFRPGDFERFYEIDQACFEPGVSYSREELARFLAHRNSRTWVAEQGADIAGFLIANRERPRVLHIVTIDVVAGWRRRGVGALLMDAAESWAKEQKLALVGLETAHDNVGAQRFYEGRGYRKVDTVEGYYANGAAAWIMVKELS